jgi:O-acetyl-ADP-ribose deacetylase (regulator of RNase III)
VITYTRGDLLRAPAEAIVNPVNCVGVMGAGLALQVKGRWPRVFARYLEDCRDGLFAPGFVQVLAVTGSAPIRYVINFPTKQDWRHGSRLAYIRDGMQDLVDAIASKGINSLAIPQLGCGLGGLYWDDVEPIIVAACRQIPQVAVLIYGTRVSE